MKPETIDTHAREYKNLCDLEKDARDKKNSKRDEILKLITKYGQVPDKAEKSKRLEGIEFQLTASFGDSVRVDAAIAEVLCDRIENAVNLGQKELAGFFARLFKFETRYTLTSEATSIMASPLPKGAPRNLRTLFAKAVVIEKREPTVKVELRKVDHA